jgi:S1-C subfamily serine protease
MGRMDVEGDQSRSGMRTDQGRDHPGKAGDTRQVGSASSNGRSGGPDRRGAIVLISGVAIVIAAVLTAFAVNDGIPGGSSSMNPSSTSINTSANAAIAGSLAQSDQAPPRSAASKMISAVLPSVVNVRVMQVSQSSTGRVGEVNAEGTGVIVSANGVIVTNNHVVQGAVQVRVVFTDGHATMSGTVIGTDPQHDIAVVKVDATGLTPATIGRSSDLSLADTVYAIGFPLDLGVTVTRGIVSGLNRSVAVKGETGSAVEHLVGLLQTDAAINPGNSGGPLVDAAGHVVGINTAGASSAAADNVGFSIAIDDSLPVDKQLLREPASQQAWLGVETVSIDSMATAAALGLDPTVRGAAIVGVIPTSPAAAAGIRAREVIVSFDGGPIGSAADLSTALAAFVPGQTVQVGLVATSGTRTVQVRLGQAPPA